VRAAPFRLLVILGLLMPVALHPSREDLGDLPDSGPKSGSSSSSSRSGAIAITSPTDPGTSSATPSIFILDRGQQPVARMSAFIRDHNRSVDTGYLHRLLNTYITEATAEGINYDIAVIQMCLETGFLRFNGTVSRFQNNFCGLGATGSTVAGDWFGSMEEGIRAHIQHLKAYASTDPLKNQVVDKRFHHVRRGTVFTIHDLTGRWATDPRYGEKLAYLLKKLYTGQ